MLSCCAGDPFTARNVEQSSVQVSELAVAELGSSTDAALGEETVPGASPSSPPLVIAMKVAEHVGPADPGAGAGAGAEAGRAEEDPASPSSSSSASAPGFEVRLKRSSEEETWGLKLETISKVAIFVSAVTSGGIAETYNKGADEGLCILQGDQLYSVNRERDTAEMLRVLQAETQVTLAFRRPRVFTITIPKRGRPLGLTAKHNNAEGFALFVGGITEDCAAKLSGADIAVGDLILAVNDKKANATAMLEEIKKSSSPTLTIARRT